jgi:hypothetical protein
LPAPRVAPYWFGALPSGLRGFPLAPGAFPSPQVPRRPRASGSSCLGLRRSFRVSRSRLAALQGLAASSSASRGVFSPFAPISAGSPRLAGLPLPLRSACRFWSTSWRFAPARALRLHFVKAASASGVRPPGVSRLAVQPHRLSAAAAPSPFLPAALPLARRQTPGRRPRGLAPHGQPVRPSRPRPFGAPDPLLGFRPPRVLPLPAWRRHACPPHPPLSL